MITGGCFCGTLRYEIEELSSSGDYKCANCHCSMCRRISAAPFVTWIVVPDTAFRIVQGTATQLISSAGALRKFCGKCGTHISFATEDRPGELDITSCSLDNPEAFVPTRGIHRRSKLAWLDTTEPSQNKDIT